MECSWSGNTNIIMKLKLDEKVLMNERFLKLDETLVKWMTIGYLKWTSGPKFSIFINKFCHRVVIFCWLKKGTNVPIRLGLYQGQGQENSEIEQSH